jgi:hypothetical protein
MISNDSNSWSPPLLFRAQSRQVAAELLVERGANPARTLTLSGPPWHSDENTLHIFSHLGDPSCWFRNAVEFRQAWGSRRLRLRKRSKRSFATEQNSSYIETVDLVSEDDDEPEAEHVEGADS